MEFIFDNDTTQSRTRPTPRASYNTFNGNSTILDTPRRTRKAVPSAIDEIEIADTRQKRTRKKAPTSKVTYVKSARKKKIKQFQWSWNKIGWLVCGVLFLRLIFMESGLIDYYKMENTLEKREYQLELIKSENSDLTTEIHQIKTNPKYQKKVAREHLGVIAQNEYLILFAKDS